MDGGGGIVLSSSSSRMDLGGGIRMSGRLLDTCIFGNWALAEAWPWPLSQGLTLATCE